MLRISLIYEVGFKTKCISRLITRFIIGKKCENWVINK